MTDLKRSLRLAGMLMQEGIDEDANENLRLKLTDRLAGLRDGYAKTVKEWGNVLREGGEIEVDVTSVAIGAMNVTGRKTTRMMLSEENVDQLFDEAGRMLAAGEGLHRTYWKRFHDKGNPSQSKLELFAIVRQGETLGCGGRGGIVRAIGLQGGINSVSDPWGVLTSGVEAYGKDVWIRRLSGWRQVLRRRKGSTEPACQIPGGDGGEKSPILRGERVISRKAIAQGMSDVLR